MAGRFLEVRGLDDARRALREFPQKLRRDTLRKALRAAADPIKAQAESDAPVLQKPVPHRISGLVQRSLVIRASRLARKKREIGVYVTVKRLSKKTVERAKRRGLAGGRNPRDPFYFRFLEMGTRKMVARSFIGPALRKQETTAVSRFSAELGKAIAIENLRK